MCFMSRLENINLVIMGPRYNITKIYTICSMGGIHSAKSKDHMQFPIDFCCQILMKHFIPDNILQYANE